jgi:hypothetical protein
LHITLETIPANIAKLMHIDETNFITPQLNVVNNAETTFAVLVIHLDTHSTLSWERALKKRNMLQHGIYHKRYVNFV